MQTYKTFEALLSVANCNGTHISTVRRVVMPRMLEEFPEGETFLPPPTEPEEPLVPMHDKPLPINGAAAFC